MKHRSLLSLAAAAALAVAVPLTASATPDIGKPAPSFTGTDSRGQSISLDTLRGKTVVLEWTNHDCPYVRKHYSVDNMQKLQREAAKDGIVWLQVISSGPGLEGHVNGPKAEDLNRQRKAAPSGVVLDPAGKIGKLYSARHTPTMVVIDPKGYGAVKRSWYGSGYSNSQDGQYAGCIVSVFDGAGQLCFQRTSLTSLAEHARTAPPQS